MRPPAALPHVAHVGTARACTHAHAPQLTLRAARPADSLTTPIVQTSTYTFRNTQELIDYQEGNYGSYEYGRYGNPTTRACEEKIRALEVRSWESGRGGTWWGSEDESELSSLGAGCVGPARAGLLLLVAWCELGKSTG